MRKNGLKKAYDEGDRDPVTGRYKPSHVHPWVRRLQHLAFLLSDHVVSAFNSLSLADFLGGAHPPPPTSFVHPPPPQHVLHPPNIYLHPPNIFAPYPRNYSIRGQAAISICSSKLFVFTASDHACFDISDALRYILGL